MPYTQQCHVVASGSFPDEGLFMFVPSKTYFDFDQEPGKVLRVALDPDKYHIAELPPQGWWVAGLLAGEDCSSEAFKGCLQSIDEIYNSRGKAYALALEDEG